MEEENKVQEELKELLQQLEQVEPIDEKGNPFSILPKKDLIKLKKNIEELSDDLTYYNNIWKGADHEETSN